MEQLYILAFDHRSSFLQMMGLTPDSVDSEIHERISHYKEVIYKGFKMAVQSEVPKIAAAVLVDEFFGQAVLQDARRRGYKFCLPVEQSGQSEFNFAYGDSFAAHIDKFKPNIVKALVRYNPAADSELNHRQRAKLKLLSNFCQNQNYPLMLEVLAPPTDEQLARVTGDIERYDVELRPALMVQMVDEIYRAGIEPMIWKLEGLDNSSHYETLAVHIQAGGRQERGLVILGRDAAMSEVETWFAAGAKVKGVIGFAVGRTIFEGAIQRLINNYLDETLAIMEIAERYTKLYQLFIKYKNF